MNAYSNQKSVREYGIVKPSALFKQAVAEDSNRIGDWLWYAGQVVDDRERLYCYDRILYIDPIHRAALRAVRTLRNIMRLQSADIHHTSPLSRLFRGAGA